MVSWNGAVEEDYSKYKPLSNISRSDLDIIINSRPKKLRRFRSKMALAHSGLGLCRVATIGDSTVAGDPGAGSVRGISDFPTQLLNQLNKAGVPISGTGSVPISQASTTSPDGRWTFSGTWADAALFRQSTSINSTATFTSTTTGTVVEISVLNGNNGQWSYNIDGAGAVTVNNVTGSGVNKITVSGLANTTHTVVITQTTATSVNVLSACVRGTSGLLISNFGVGGSTTTTWVSPTYTGTVATLAETPDLVLINLGINDYFTSMSLSLYESNLIAIINTYIGSSDIVLAIGNPVSAIYSPARSDYIAVAKKVANKFELPLLDLIDRWGDYADVSGLGLLHTDGTHPTPAGNSEIAKAWRELIKF